MSTNAIGDRTKIWEPSNVYDSIIGDDCSIGAFTELGGAILGDRVKVQAHCFIPQGIIVEDDVFIGPRVTFTNVKKPNPTRPADTYSATVVCNRVVVGAGAVICPGITLGVNCFVAAGAVVVRDVLEGTMVAGNPAKYIGPSPNK